LIQDYPKILFEIPAAPRQHARPFWMDDCAIRI
jgi:hypothetical protein